MELIMDANPGNARLNGAGSLFERVGGRERLQFLLKHFYADVR